MKRLLAVPILAIVLLAGAGCARTSMTIDDYAIAYERYAQCLDDAGTPLIEHDLSEPIFDYSVPMSAVYLGTDDWCYADFREADETWRQTQRSSSGSR